MIKYLLWYIIVSAWTNMHVYIFALSLYLINEGHFLTFDIILTYASKLYNEWAYLKKFILSCER